MQKALYLVVWIVETVENGFFGFQAKRSIHRKRIL
jgi:hypothetical protein